MEFVAASGEDNLQDRIALLGEQTGETSVEREVSLRLLRHLASSPSSARPGRPGSPASGKRATRLGSASFC